MPNSKAAFGNRANLDTALTDGTITNYDVLHLSDTQEMGWIDKDGNVVIAKSRTQDSITVNGVDGLGVKNGETIPAGTSTDELVKMLVQKEIPATYMDPELNFTVVDSAEEFHDEVEEYYETGYNIGSLTLSAEFVQNDAGALTSLVIKKNNDIVATGAGNTISYDASSLVVEDTSIVFKAVATYGDGAVKKDNMEEDSPDGVIKAGTIEKTLYTLNGVRRIFFGSGTGECPELVSDFIRSLDFSLYDETVMDVEIPAGNKYIVFAYPSSLPDLKSVTYVDGGDTRMLSKFTSHSVSVADNRGAENGLMEYKVYTFEMAVPAAADMTFRFEI